MPRQVPSARVEIERLEPRHLAATATVWARALRDNPLTVAVYGPDPDLRFKSLRGGFVAQLGAGSHEVLVVRRLRRIVGALGWTSSESCVGTLTEAAADARSRVAPDGSQARAITTMEVAGARDLPEPHVHFGPMGVVPRLQGRGIGRRLLEQGLALTSPSVGWLETDLLINARFYGRLGFVTVDEADVLDTHYWFMRRAG